MVNTAQQFGIQDPSMFELNTLQAGANQQPMETQGGSTSSKFGIVQPQAAPQQQEPSSLDMQKELLEIQTLANNQAPQGSGIGQTIGTVGGTGAAMAFGADPMTASAVGGLTGSVGATVDWFIEKEARDRAEIAKEVAIKKETDRQVKKSATQSWLQQMADFRGISLSRDQEAKTEQDVLNEMRMNLMSNMLSNVNQKAQNDETLRQKFLKSRSI